MALRVCVNYKVELTITIQKKYRGAKISIMVNEHLFAFSFYNVVKRYDSVLFAGISIVLLGGVEYSFELVLKNN